MPSADVLERLQALYLADDLEVPESALAWTEEEAHTFFDSGGLKRPAPAPAPSPPAAPAPDPPAAPAPAAPPDGRLRWIVDITAWEPGEAEWAALLRQLPEVDSTKVMKYRFRDDQKRAMASRLLQRRASADVFGIAPAAVRIERTKGSKPYLANPRKNSPRQPAAAAAASTTKLPSCDTLKFQLGAATSSGRSRRCSGRCRAASPIRSGRRSARAGRRSGRWRCASASTGA